MASLLLILLKVAVLAVAATAFLSHLGRPYLLAFLNRLPPAQRANALLIWCWLPTLFGLSAAAVAAGPTLASAWGWAPGHCPVPQGATHHHCALHPGAALGLPSAELWLGLAVLLVLALGVFKAMVLIGGQRPLWTLARVADSDGRALILDTARPFAATLGLMRPRIVLSRGLKQTLSESDRAVVQAHEAAHCRRRDPLRLVLAQLGAVVHSHSTRLELLNAFGLATEQAADERAAMAVGERLRVAETIVRVARQHPHTAGGTGFTGGLVDNRVRALLAEPRQRPFHGALEAPFVVSLAALAFSAAEIHHALEALLTQILG